MQTATRYYGEPAQVPHIGRKLFTRPHIKLSILLGSLRPGEILVGYCLGAVCDAPIIEQQSDLDKLVQKFESGMYQEVSCWAVPSLTGSRIREWCQNSMKTAAVKPKQRFWEQEPDITELPTVQTEAIKLADIQEPTQAVATVNSNGSTVKTPIPQKIILQPIPPRLATSDDRGVSVSVHSSRLDTKSLVEREVQFFCQATGIFPDKIYVSAARRRDLKASCCRINQFLSIPYNICVGFEIVLTSGPIAL